MTAAPDGDVRAAAESSLPGSMREAVLAELVRAVHPPFETPIVVVVNGLLMTGLWFLLPADNAMFRFHGSLAFPMILASWMYSDVPATNVLGSDASRSIRALDDPTMLRRLLYAKNLALWTLIAPLCSLIAIGIGIDEKRVSASILTIAWIAVVPLGALGLAAWLGIVFPYHPITLRRRWEHRRPFGRMIVRWLALVLIPYGLVPLLGVAVSIPTITLWGLRSGQGGFSRISDADFAVGVLLACVVAMVAWIGGHHFSVRIAQRRSSKLVAFLADPDLG